MYNINGIKFIRAETSYEIEKKKFKRKNILKKIYQKRNSTKETKNEK